MEKDGYDVITTMDGQEALDRLTEMPDLVLTDIDMRQLDGLGLLRRMRAEKNFRDIPVRRTPLAQKRQQRGLIWVQTTIYGNPLTGVNSALVFRPRSGSGKSLSSHRRSNETWPSSSWPAPRLTRSTTRWP